MYCHKCGKYLEEKSLYCCYCGTKMPEELDENEQIHSDYKSNGYDKGVDDNCQVIKKGSRKYMNTKIATIITFIVDALALVLGSILVAIIGVKGMLVLFVVFLLLIRIHKTCYKALTGKEWGTKENQSTESWNCQQQNHSDQTNVNELSIQEHKVEKDSCQSKEFNNDNSTRSLPSQIGTNFIIIRDDGFKAEELSHPQLIPSNNSLEEISNNNHKTEHTNFFTSAISKVIHVKIVLSKSAIFCIIAILLTIIACICIVTCNKANNEDVIIEDKETAKPPSYETEEEKWDSKNCVYSNFKYGIAFDLPEEIVWHKTSGIAQHTIVKFVQPESGLTIFVNVNPIINIRTHDIWEVYEQYTEMLSMAIDSTKKSMEEKIVDFYTKKVEFCGKHAIKYLYKSEFFDDRYEKTLHYTAIDYHFIYNNSTIILSTKCNDDVLDSLINDNIKLEDFLKCFHLIPISERFRSDHESFEGKMFAEILIQTAKEINNLCPIRVDDITTIKQVSFDGYNLVYMQIIDAEQFKKMNFNRINHKNTIIANLKETMPNFQEIANNLNTYGYGMAYNIYTSDGKFQYTINISGYDMLNK